MNANYTEPSCPSQFKTVQHNTHTPTYGSRTQKRNQPGKPLSL
jgi:hypothetical protein